MSADRHLVRAKLALAVAARDTADAARTVVGNLGRPALPGERIEAARRLRVLAMAVLDSALMVEIASGTSWAQAADALGLSESEARRRYAATIQLWLDAGDLPGLDLTVGNHGGDTLHPDDDPAGMAEAIDRWYVRHAEPWETPGPVGILD